MNSSSLTKCNIQKILENFIDLGARGFGGKCAGFAIAINEELFSGRGEYIVAINEFLWKKHQYFVGHVVVRFNGVLWDGDARPKNVSDIDDWGDISEDPYYRGVFKNLGSRWTIKRATTTQIYILDTKCEISWGNEDAENMRELIKKAIRLVR